MAELAAMHLVRAARRDQVDGLGLAGIEHLTENELNRIRGDIEAEFGEKSVRTKALERVISRR